MVAHPSNSHVENSLPVHMELVLASLTASMQLSIAAIAQPNVTGPDCDPAYAEVCIPPAPPI